MSFSDYVNHITQKYRLAVAIAVIKNKPENHSIQEYITILRNKINDEMEIDDLDITIDSDDFKFDDDDVVNGIDDGKSLIYDNEAASTSMTILKEFDVNMKSVEDDNVPKATAKEKNDIQATYFESTQATNISTVSKPINNNNTELYCDFDHNYANYGNVTQNGDIANSEDIDSRIVAAISKNINNVANANESCKESEINVSSSTELENYPHSRKNKNNPANTVSINLGNASHGMPTNANNAQKNKNTAKNSEKLNQSEKSYEFKDTARKIYKNIQNDANSEMNTTKEDKEKVALNKLQESDYNRDTNDSDGKLANKIYNNINKTNEDNIEDSQSTLLYTLYGFTQNLTHVSQSQFDNIHIGQEFIIGNRYKSVQDDKNNTVHDILPNDWNNITKDTENRIQDFPLENCSQIELSNDNNVRNNQNNQNFHGNDYMHFNPPSDYNNIVQETANNNQQFQSHNNMQIDLTNDNNRYSANNSQDFFSDSNLIISQPNDYNNMAKKPDNNQEIQTQIIQVENIDKNMSNEISSGNIQIVNVDTNNIQYIIDKYGRKYAILNANDKINESIATEVSEKINSQLNASSVTQAERHEFPKNDVTIQVEDNAVYTLDSDDDLTVSQKEIVPFKVIEELNKVKTFLNRKDRRVSTDVASDSGYKSDSQSRSSYKTGLQLSGNWLNQSAHCLFSYMVQCSLLSTTHDITNEISQVLGKLIDRLHEEETYPSFLEEILEKVDTFLQEIYEGEGSCDNVLQKNDEYIQRIFLLNKSLHIIEHTIGKITDILEKTCNNLTKEDMYELTNIDQIENICYIFHILEFLIQRYIKNKNLLSQENTQPSQSDEKILKKSSITDIWRKKWNPDYKSEEKIEESVEKKCVLIKCSEVLNKIIVECMDGYSLVAFAALQCFNLLQS